jgi:hypothetical protein
MLYLFRDFDDLNGEREKMALQKVWDTTAISSIQDFEIQNGRRESDEGVEILGTSKGSKTGHLSNL